MYVHIMTYNMAMGAKRDDSKPLIPKDDALDAFACSFSNTVNTSRLDPWVICVQEIDRDYKGTNQVDELQNQLQHNTDTQWWKNSNTLPDSSSDEAVAIFANRQIVKVQRWSLPADRVAVAVKIELGDGHYLWVVNMHPIKPESDPDGSERVESIQYVLQQTATFDATVPIAICGDMNIWDTHPGTYSNKVAPDEQTLDQEEDLFQQTIGKCERFCFTRGKDFVPGTADITFHAWSDTSDQNQYWDLLDYILVNEAQKCTADRPTIVNYTCTSGTSTVYLSDHKGLLMTVGF